MQHVADYFETEHFLSRCCCCKLDSNGLSLYQYASVQVSIVQVHPYPDDSYVGPRTLHVIGGVVATGGRSAVRFCGTGWS